MKNREKKGKRDGAKGERKGKGWGEWSAKKVKKRTGQVRRKMEKGWERKGRRDGAGQVRQRKGKGLGEEGEGNGGEKRMG